MYKSSELKGTLTLCMLFVYLRKHIIKYFPLLVGPLARLETPPPTSTVTKRETQSENSLVLSESHSWY